MQSTSNYQRIPGQPTCWLDGILTGVRYKSVQAFKYYYYSIEDYKNDHVKTAILLLTGRRISLYEIAVRSPTSGELYFW
jgi:hypothetical protein